MEIDHLAFVSQLDGPELNPAEAFHLNELLQVNAVGTP